MSVGGVHVDFDSLPSVLEAAAGDARDSATDVALRVAAALEEWGRGSAARPSGRMDDLVRRLIGLRPSMAPLLRLADTVASSVEMARPERRSKAMAVAAGEFAFELASSPSRIAKQVLTFCGDVTRIATYSGGASIRVALQELHRAGRPISVVVSEARPALEGVALAEDLARAGIPVRLVTDAALPGELSGVEALWLGCDALVPNGVVHKVGTAHLARAAALAGVEVVVLASQLKRLGPDLAARIRLAAGNPDSIYRGPLPGLRPACPLSDVTPWKLVGRVASEEGVRPGAAARQEVGRLRSTGALARLGVIDADRTEK
jgi:translation initiation factor 2B subunit (eIF-2B alpha/beta/delta family)